MRVVSSLCVEGALADYSASSLSSARVAVLPYFLMIDVAVSTYVLLFNEGKRSGINVDLAVVVIEHGYISCISSSAARIEMLRSCLADAGRHA